MDLFEDESFLLNDLLDRIGEKLQLDTTRRERAEESYAAVIKYLENSDSLFGKQKLEVYPQGSFAIQTTVKPLANDEYDLDFVLEVALDWKKIPKPTLLLEELFRTLRANGRYSAACEKMKRCVRLNYAGEFHMDILPACPNNDLGGTNLKIPDRSTMSWTDSNPKGFAGWFETRAAARLILEKIARAEPIPDDLPYEFKPPLKRAVQLMKRYRDVYFQKMEAYTPKSIVLTTLGGMFYLQDTNAFSAILSILKGINTHLSKSPGVIEIPNPSNSNENLGDSWQADADAYQGFKKFIADFCHAWESLGDRRNPTGIAGQLETMFGERIAREVLSEQREFIGRRKQKTAGVVPATIAIANPPKPWMT